ncbi:hypothetical protein M1D88_18310 [Arthrobacter sp. R1-13]
MQRQRTTAQADFPYERTGTAPPWMVVWGSVVAAALCAGFLALIPLSQAAAVQPGTQNVVVSANAKRGTPHVLDGYVAGFAQVGDLTVATGNFTRVRNDSSTTEIARTNIFAFNSANSITDLNVALTGEIMDVLAVGDGVHVWIAGSFNSVNGVTARGLAKINVFTGQQDTSFAPPAFDGRVNQMRLRNGLLYLAGRFMNAGPTARSLFAAVNPSTGALAPNVSLDISVPRQGALQMSRMDITPDGRRMVGIGNFTMANGQSRKQILMADLTTSPTSLANWSTEGYAPACSLAFDSYMRDVDISPDGKYFVIVTTGGYYANTLCDTAARFEIGAGGSDVKPTWVDYTGGDTLTRVAVTQTTVYLGGHQRWLNNPFAGGSAGPGAVERMGLAAVDVRNGLPLAWNPGRTRGYGVYSFVATDTGLWIGSDTDRISNFQYHGRLAFMPVQGGTPLLPDYPGELPGTVFLAGAATDDNGTALPPTSLIQRSFSGTAVTASSVMATSQPFGSMRGTFMIDNKLYSGRTDGTFRVQTFDGTTFGTASVIDQRGLTDFPANVTKITGMFYDTAASRMYYTLSGDSRLYYRHFSTEINVIGAEQFVAPSNASSPAWSTTRSLMLDGANLYVADSTGVLKRWAWNAKTAVAGGTPATISGPTVDGKSWAATQAFLYSGGELDQPPVAPPTPTPTPTPTPELWPLFKSAYDPTIYELVNVTPVPLSYEKWTSAYKQQPPTLVPTDFVKYPWSPSIYMVMFFPGGENAWLWKRLSYQQWLSAGQPSPRIAGWIKGSYYYQWRTSSEIFVKGEDGVTHKLTYPEWQASGLRPFEHRSAEGFLKLTWAPEIARMSNVTNGAGRPLGYAEWQAEAFPTPAAVQRIQGDQFYKDYGSPTVYYAGPGMNRAVSFAEWQAAGSPTPTVRNAPARG